MMGVAAALGAASRVGADGIGMVASISGNSMHCRRHARKEKVVLFFTNTTRRTTGERIKTGGEIGRLSG